MPTESNHSRPPGLSWRQILIAIIAAEVLSLVLLQPALRGAAVSDDITLLVGRAYLEAFTFENLRTVFDLQGDPVQITANWAPVQQLAHMLELQLFGSPLENPYPFHLVNCLLHGFNAILFSALLATQGVPLVGVFIAGLLFLIHPANVEVAVWISQLKTLLAFSLGFGALLQLPRNPLTATVLFALALLSKPTASAVLAGAIVFEWQRRPVPGDPPRRTRWLFAWGLLLLLYALPEFLAFRQAGEFHDALPSWTRFLQAIAIMGRYLALTLTSFGSSTFHQPLAPQSPLDIWFAFGFLALLASGTAIVAALTRRHPAAGWLGLAAAAYAPISQIFPFRYPMADRYLYFVLPGLLGAVALVLAPRIAAGLAAMRVRDLLKAPLSLRIIALGVVLVVCVFAIRFHQRAIVWSSPDLIIEDAARHYPNGILGQIALARRLVAKGDLEGATAAIARARDRGHTSPYLLLSDPALQPLQYHSPYMKIVSEMTAQWIESIEALPRPSFASLAGVVRAELFLGRISRARDALSRAEAVAGENGWATVLLLRHDLEEMESLQRSVRGGD